MSEQTKLSNMYPGLHNFSDVSEIEMCRANYLFFSQSPMYVALERKYKEAKKKVREQRRMIDVLNLQNMEILERYASRQDVSKFSELRSETSKCGDRLVEKSFSKDFGGVSSTSLSDMFSKIKIEPTSPVPCIPENVVYKVIPVIDVDSEPEINVKEKTAEEPVEVMEEEEETEETETEEVEVVEEETEEEETEEVEVVEEEETEETETEEEEGVYEIEINGKRYYTTNDVNGTIYSILADEDIGDEIGAFVNGKAVFHC